MGRFDMEVGPSLSDLMTQRSMQQAQIGAMGQESQLRNLQMQTAQRGVQDQEQLRALLPQLMQSGDPQGTLKSLMMSGNPQAMEMAGKMAPILASLQKDDTITYEDFGGYKQGRNPRGVLVGERIEKTPAPKEFQPSDLARLTTEMNTLPQGDPRRRLYLNAITKMTTHAPGTSVSYGSPVAGTDAQGNPIFFQPGKNGGSPSIIPGVRPAPSPNSEKAPTEAESKAAFYAGNMRAASKAYDDLTSKGFDTSTGKAQIDTSLAGGWTNPLAGTKARLAKQSQNQWSEQMLRMLTGAAATTDEINRNNATYFPKIGDGPAEVAQKKEMRRQAENGIFEAAGRAKPRVGVQNAPAAMDIHAQADAILNGGK